MSIKEKLTRIQSEIKAPKNLYNTFGGYKYRNAEGICEAVKPYLQREKCCLTLSDTIGEAGGRVYVEAAAALQDAEDGGCITVTAYAREADSKKGMDAAQVTGATSSYARKYALNGLFLLDDTKDPDSDEFWAEQEERRARERDAKKTEEVGKQKISQTKALALRRMFADKKVDEAKVLVLYKAERLEDLTEKQHANIWSHIDQIAERCSI